jgi:hypothetical protein
MGSDSGSVPRLNDLDTVPPPEGGDAYANATVVRAAPSEILDAIRRASENDAKTDANIDTDTKGDTKVEEDVIVAPVAALPSDSPQLEKLADLSEDKTTESESVAKIAIPLDPAALKPARVPDFEKLMSQRAEVAVVPTKLPESANVNEGPMDPSPRRTKTVLSVIVVVLVVWLAILAAVAVSHVAGR